MAALIQLYTFGYGDTEQAKKSVLENISIPFENNNIELPRRYGDAYIPKLIISDKEITELHVKIGGNTIFVSG